LSDPGEMGREVALSVLLAMVTYWGCRERRKKKDYPSLKKKKKKKKTSKIHDRNVK
jgi:hypothetical protein